jgi:hypothetical protein
MNSRQKMKQYITNCVNVYADKMRVQRYGFYYGTSSKSMSFTDGQHTAQQFLHKITIMLFTLHATEAILFDTYPFRP